MVNELRQLLRESVDSPPYDGGGLAAVVRGGRRRARRRRLTVIGGSAIATAIATAGVIGLASHTWPGAPDIVGLPAPSASTLHLSDAAEGVEGRDYRVLASYTNDNLDRDNGQYFDGVTDDGLILFRDGPRMGQLQPRFALMDPATGDKDWLPELDIGQAQTWPLALNKDRLVLVNADGGGMRLTVYVFDRSVRTWSTLTWPDLPRADAPRVVMGPDDRLYVSLPATQGQPPKGGWPMVNGEAEDSDAKGDTYALWSASMTDPSDVHDEGLLVGDVAFTDDAMVWTDRTNGDSGLIHVRDLDSGQEHSFDPHSGERCNLLNFGAAGDRVVLGQYCGTYKGEVRDDRVQIVSTDGDQIVTLQDSSIEGGLVGPSDVVTVTSYEPAQAGTYVYDLASDRFLRVSDSVSKWSLGGPTPRGDFMWHTAVNHGKGATQWLGRMVPR
jgi:hypothetical protein